MAKYVLEDLVLPGVWDLKIKAAVRAHARHLLGMPLLLGYRITPFTNEYRFRRTSVQRIAAEIGLTLDAWGAHATSYPLASLASPFGANTLDALDLVDGQRGVRRTTEVVEAVG